MTADAPTRLAVESQRHVARRAEPSSSRPPLMLDDQLRSVPGFSLFRRTSSRVANPTTQGVTLRGLSASGASRTLVLADDVPLERSVRRLGLLGSRAGRRAAARGRDSRRIRRPARQRRARRRHPPDHAHEPGRRSCVWTAGRWAPGGRRATPASRTVRGRRALRRKRERPTATSSSRPESRGSDRHPGRLAIDVCRGLGDGHARLDRGRGARRLLHREPQQRHPGADQRDDQPLGRGDRPWPGSAAARGKRAAISVAEIIARRFPPSSARIARRSV